MRSFQFDGRGNRREVLAPGDVAADSHVNIDGAAADLVEQFDADADEQPEHGPFAQPLAVGFRVGQFRFQHVGHRHLRYGYLGHRHVGYGYLGHRHVRHWHVRVDGAGRRVPQQQRPRSQSQRLAAWFRYHAIWHRYDADWYRYHADWYRFDAFASRQFPAQSQPVFAWLGRLAVSPGRVAVRLRLIAVSPGRLAI